MPMARPRNQHRRSRHDFLIRATLAFALLAVLVGCHGFFTDPVLTSITVSPTSTSVGIGSTAQLSANGVFNDGSSEPLSNSQVTWTSSEPTVATVSNAGVVTGVATGTATITATDQSFTATSSITVNVANLVSISVSPTSAVLSSGGTTNFVATGLLANGSTVDLTNSATWTSSNTAVATISTSGVATALTVTTTSTTNITATSGGITSNSAVLTVNP